tara:strand:- start:158 stop:421 length:264 start_codon:yes stop_codon:yes gene_type:complete
VTNTYKQYPDDLYVCVRLRDDWGGDPDMIERLGPFTWKEARVALKKAVEKYGPRHKCVLEPVERAVFPSSVETDTSSVENDTTGAIE